MSLCPRKSRKASPNPPTLSRGQADKETSVKTSEEENDLIFDPIVMENSCPLQPKLKQYKEQRNLSRKQDLKPASQSDKRTERAKKQLAREEEEDKRRSIMPQHAIEVDVEINMIDNSEVEKTPSHPVQPCSKRKFTTPQRARRKPQNNTAAASGVPSPSPSVDSATNTVPSSPSHTSIISDTAVEELCNLRNYYSKQLRRINYISHEYLGQPTEPGVLACIREPLRSFRLPRRATIAQTARSLWTRVSSRRKLVQL